MNNFLAFDLGGTSVKYSLISEDGKIHSRGSFPTKFDTSADLLNKIAETVREFQSDNIIKGVGISCPGVVDPVEGKILGFALNMPRGWHNEQIKNKLEHALNLPVEVENDVNAAALGELWLGAAKEFKNFICIAVGTGIGGGIVINGSLYYGANYHAGEAGLIRANKGATSFWEKNASALSLVDRIKHYVSNYEIGFDEQVAQIDGKWIFDHAVSNSGVKAILEDWADYLAGGIADIVSVLDPEAVILGGGISEQGDALIDLVDPKLRLFLPKSFSVILKTAKLGNDAAKLGVIKKLCAL
ncbi:MAG: ROK family protein [Brevinemataceae bacterium]